MYSCENTCRAERSQRHFHGCSSVTGPCRRARETPTHLEEQVEPKQSAAGDDGEAGSVPAGDGLWHVGRVLRGSREDGGEFYNQTETEAASRVTRRVKLQLQHHNGVPLDAFHP